MAFPSLVRREDPQEEFFLRVLIFRSWLDWRLARNRTQNPFGGDWVQEYWQGVLIPSRKGRFPSRAVFSSSSPSPLGP